MQGELQVSSLVHIPSSYVDIPTTGVAKFPSAFASYALVTIQQEAHFAAKIPENHPGGYFRPISRDLLLLWTFGGVSPPFTGNLVISVFLDEISCLVLTGTFYATESLASQVGMVRDIGS